MKRCNSIKILVCFSQIMIFFTTGNTQESKSVIDTANFPRISFAFHRTMLQETDMKDTRSAIGLWIKTVGDQTGFDIESFIYEDVDSLLHDYRKGILDFLNLGPPTQLQIEKELNVEPAYAPIIGGKKTRRYLLIVRSDSPFTEIKDLKNKKLALLKINEAGYIYLSVLLMREKLEKPEKFFSGILDKTKYSQAILSVFFGQADACIATDIVYKTMIELNPQIGDKIKILASSPELIHMVAFTRLNMDKKTRDAVLQEIFRLENTPVGRQVLMLFGIEKVVPASESDFETMRALMKEYTELLKKSLF